MSIEMAMYRLADALGTTLELKDGKISGSIMGRVKLGPLSVQLSARVVKMFQSEQIGVLVHVMGHLYMVVSHYGKTGMTSTYLVDASKLKLDGVITPPELLISKTMTIAQVVDAIKDGIVKAYYHSKGQWKPLTLTK